MLQGSTKGLCIASAYPWILTSLRQFAFDYCWWPPFYPHRKKSIWMFSAEVRKVKTSYHTFEENSEIVNLPYLKPTDMLQHLLNKEPWLLLGGMAPGPNVSKMLATFWSLYRHEHPSHIVFDMETKTGLKLDHTIPLLLHGDGGRTAKKQPLEVYSFLPVLGLDTLQTKLRCKCSFGQTYSANDFSDAMAQRLNNRNNSYLTHFLLFAFPSKHYKKTPGLLKEMIAVVSREFEQCCTNPMVSPSGEVWHFAVIGSRGDAEWHAKTGILLRSYQNVGHKNQLQCCHECLAGDRLYPFEDFRQEASWKQTVYSSAPWNDLPPFATIPFDVAGWQSGAAARFFRRDPLHVFRLGIARNFIASAIISLCLDGHFDGSPEDSHSIGERLSRAWGMFSLWMETQKLSVSGIRSFSKEKLHFPTMKSFPLVGCKGSDSITLLKWLVFVGGLKNEQLIVKAARSGLSFQAIHGHGLWLKPACRETVQSSVKSFLRSYAFLAKGAMEKGRTLYGMVPKAHAFHHIERDLEEAKHRSYSINPATFDCSMSEDFVGHVARQSRRISYKNVVENTLLAYKIRGPPYDPKV